MADMPIPVMRHPVLEPVAPERRADPAPVILGRDLVRRELRVGLVEGAEQRDPDVLPMLEPGLHPHPDPHVFGVDIDQVGDQPDPRVLFDRDGGDHERSGETGIPGMVVHRHPDHHGAPGDIPHFEVLGPAIPADGHGRVQQGTARSAHGEAQHPVSPRLPIEAVVVVQHG